MTIAELEDVQLDHLPGTWDELVELGKHCLYVRKLADYAFARVCRAMLDGPGSKTQRDVAAALGCSEATVTRTVQALSKITEISNGNPDDLDNAYDDAMRDLRRPKPQPESLPPAPQPQFRPEPAPPAPAPKSQSRLQPVPPVEPRNHPPADPEPQVPGLTKTAQCGLKQGWAFLDTALQIFTEDPEAVEELTTRQKNRINRNLKLITEMLS